MLDSPISRRDFLKLAAAGSLAFALKDLRLDGALAASLVRQGCMTISGVPLYDAPTFKANQIHFFGKDEVVEVTAIEENGDFGNDFNSTWYQINGEGYSYSGLVYPVETNY